MGIYETAKETIKEMTGEEKPGIKVSVEETRGTLGGVIVKIESITNEAVYAFQVREGDKYEVEHMTRYAVDRIMRNGYKEMVTLEEIERALGIKLEKWQREYILSEGLGYPMQGRRTGRTLAHKIKTLIKAKEDIRIRQHERKWYPDYNQGANNSDVYARNYIRDLRELSEMLRKKGVNVPRVIEEQGDGIR